jgi:general secretion pathway protein B
MSYILDALKKSDQQRNLGVPPTLQVAQLTVAARRKPSLFHYGLLAVVLLGAGVVIGLLRPWQAEQEQMPSESESIAQGSPVPISQKAAPSKMTAPPEMPGAMKPNDPAPVHSEKRSAAVPIPDKTMPDKFISEKSAGSSGDAPQQNAISYDELPGPIQREIPELTTQLHAYSTKSSERLVYINSKKLQEGDSLMPGLRLEQITPDGMIFSYKGYRFKRGIR